MSDLFLDDCKDAKKRKLEEQLNQSLAQMEQLMRQKYGNQFIDYSKQVIDRASEKGKSTKVLMQELQQHMSEYKGENENVAKELAVTAKNVVQEIEAKEERMPQNVVMVNSRTILFDPPISAMSVEKFRELQALVDAELAKRQKK